MAYNLTSAQQAPVLDATGTPVPVGTLPGQTSDPGIATFGAAANSLTVVGVNPGTADVSFTRDGVTAKHTVTVTAAPFDWTLGTPLAK